MPTPSRAALTLLWVSLGAVLWSCGDQNALSRLDAGDSTTEAEVARAVEEINERRWDAAIERLLPLDQGQYEVRKYLASAYMGRAGFDAFEWLLRVLAQGASRTGRSALYEAVIQIVGDPDGDGQVTGKELQGRVGDTVLAVRVLAPADRVRSAVRDEVFQGGMYAAINLALIIGGLFQDLDASPMGIARLSEAELEAALDLELILAVAEQVAIDAVLIADLARSFPEHEVEIELSTWLEELGLTDGELTPEDLFCFFRPEHGNCEVSR